MKHAILTKHAAVLEAIDEYNEVGREEFLRKYGFNRGKYFLLVDGMMYDARPIYAAAHGYEHPQKGALAAFNSGFKAEDVFRDLGFVVSGAQPVGLAPPTRVTPDVELRNAQHEAQARGEFDPTSVVDERQKAIRAIVLRQGQPAFRRELVRAYDQKCAITGCATLAVLEAAHITPYRGPQTNHVSNGLLLRSDLHTLFDLYLLSVDPDSNTVIVDSALRSGEYGSVHGQKLHLPNSALDQPSKDALFAHFLEAGIES